MQIDCVIIIILQTCAMLCEHTTGWLATIQTVLQILATYAIM